MQFQTNPKILSFRPEIPGFHPGIFGTESKRGSNELLNSLDLRTVKMQPELKGSIIGHYDSLIIWSLVYKFYKINFLGPFNDW